MHRFYVEAARSDASIIDLPERESHHAVHVLRTRIGERVAALDGAGSELLCEVVRADKHQIQLKVLQRTAIASLGHEITLAQAVPKGKSMEEIVQKATELGVHQIVPLLSERTVPQLEADQRAAKAEKWQTTAIEAIKQCGLAWLPRIETARSPAEFLAQGEKFDLSFVASLQSEARHPRSFFDEFRKERGRAPKTICVWVGPEGDFTPAEINHIRAGGSLPITLGPLVLRCETAAIYALSIINYELQSSVISNQ